MEPFDGIAGRCLGYLGLFLIGAISWAADHLDPAPGSRSGWWSRAKAPSQTEPFAPAPFLTRIQRPNG